MKVLKDEQFASLKAKADNYDSIVNAMIAGNDSLTAEDVTPEVIQAAIENEGDNADETLSTRITDLETKVQTLNDSVTTLTTERDNLQTEVEELRVLPGADSVTTSKPAAEAATIITDDLLSFATEHKGDTAAIAAKMIETGFIKQKNK
jgi:uncharacterized protein YlxW (UPF0749 family)